MAYQLKEKYGKQSVPVFKIRKEGARHSIIDMVVKIMLEGDVSDSWLTGNNHQIVPTETQKNTCYALALKTDYDCGEDYGVALSRDMLSRHRHIHRVTVDVDERLWERVKINGQEHNHVFSTSCDPVKRKCTVVATRSSVKVTSGMGDIKLMKTTQSGFKGYIQDQYTTLAPTGEGTGSPDRIMCTELESSWTYTQQPVDGYRASNDRIFATLLEVWSGPPHNGVFSSSVQETAYKMATTVLKRFGEIDEVYLGTPNVHFYPSPLHVFGMSNPNVVFQSTDCHTTASGRIETRVSRKKAKL